MNFVQNIIWNSVEGFVEAGTRTAGGYAGDALVKAGDLIEGAGRSVGYGIERTASGYGSKISSGAPPPTAAKRPPVKRSLSSPASTTPRPPTAKTPSAMPKYPTGKTITAPTKSSVGAAKKTIGATPTTQTKTAQTKPTTTKTAIKSNPLPKPYPNRGPTAPATKTPHTPIPLTPYQAPSVPEKKTPVRPGGASKPFHPPAGTTSAAAKNGVAEAASPYPGTNAVPQVKKRAVRAQRDKRLG